VNLERELEGLKAELANFQGDAEARAELEATIDMKNDKKVRVGQRVCVSVRFSDSI
jgi:hypothetical protein